MATYHVGPLVADLQLGAIQDGTASSAVFAKLEGALRVIAQADPRRFRRLRFDVDAIVVTDLLAKADAKGLYMPGSRTCYLDHAWVESRSDADVALMIVHESAHARLDRLWPTKWHPVVERIEHRCLREELSFASRLSESDFPGIGQWRVNRERSSRYRTSPRKRTVVANTGDAA
jgi:hypothetical protein